MSAPAVMAAARDGAMTAEYMGERPSGATDVPLAMTTGHAIFFS